MFWFWFIWQWEASLTCYDNSMTVKLVDEALHQKWRRILLRVGRQRMLPDNYKRRKGVKYYV